MRNTTAGRRQRTPEKESVKTDRKKDKLTSRDIVSHKTQIDGQGNSGTTGDEGLSQPQGPSGKKTKRGLITAVLIGALLLAAVVIGYTVHSRNSKKQETVERVSETQKVSEKDNTETAKNEEATYALTVENGTGTGSYHAGDSVSIKADVEEGYSFSVWEVNKGNITLSDNSAEQTTFIMGNEDVEITAVVTEAETQKMQEMEQEPKSQEGSVISPEEESQEESESILEVQAQEAFEQGLAAYEDENYGNAVSWYVRAANLGNVSAIISIGEMYEFGNGVEQDYKKAIYWYQKAADLGVVKAQKK